MRKLFVIGLFIPFIGMGQVKNVLNSTRVFIKPDKNAEFEKAIASHAQKYHTGDWKWRVWSIETGPDAGGYMITEGPSSWERIDGRGDLGAEHTADWDKNIAPLTEGHGSQGYFEFDEALSTVQLTDYADKIVINYMVANPGKIGGVVDLIKKLKKTWQSGKESVAVYRVAVSGEPTYITVTRLKQGLKELATGFRPEMSVRYNTDNGEGAFAEFLKDYAGAVQKRWSELLFYKPNLSSK